MAKTSSKLTKGLNFSDPSYISEYLDRKNKKRSTEAYGTSLYHLRDKDAGEMSPLLRSLINAYAPHTKAPTVSELEKRGCVRIEKESTMEDLREVYFENHGFYPEDHPDLINEEDNENPVV